MEGWFIDKVGFRLEFVQIFPIKFNYKQSRHGILHNTDKKSLDITIQAMAFWITEMRKFHLYINEQMVKLIFVHDFRYERHKFVFAEITFLRILCRQLYYTTVTHDDHLFIEPWTKWLQFLEWKILNFEQNFIEVCNNKFSLVQVMV